MHNTVFAKGKVISKCKNDTPPPFYEDLPVDHVCMYIYILIYNGVMATCALEAH